MGGDGQSAVYLAAIMGHFEVVKFLVLKGADLRKVDGMGLTPLEFAALQGLGHVRIVLFLIKSGARLEEFGTAMRKCKACGKIDMKMCLCKGCHMAFYCSEECATKDWYDGGADRHQSQCNRIKKRRDRYIERVVKEAEEEKVKKFKETVSVHVEDDVARTSAAVATGEHPPTLEYDKDDVPSLVDQDEDEDEA